MPTIADQLARLDQRIAYLEKSATDLRQQIAGINKNTLQYVRLNDLVLMGDRTATQLRGQREKLANQGRAAE